jgi:hypothetical protein
MGLKIGDNIYLMDIDENTPIVLQTNNFLTITLPYMNEVLFSIGHEFVFFFYNITNIPLIFITMGCNIHNWGTNE